MVGIIDPGLSMMKQYNFVLEPSWMKNNKIN